MQCSGCKFKEQALSQGGYIQKNDQMYYIVDGSRKKAEKKSRSKYLQSQKQQQENKIYFCCSCCRNLFCLECCRKHKQLACQEKKEQNVEDKKKTGLGIQTSNQKEDRPQEKQMIWIICQECEDMHSVKYCQNCGQYLCEKCSFKIHNKGKRAKHILEENIERSVLVHGIVLLTTDWFKYLKENSKGTQIFQDNFGSFVKEKLEITSKQVLFLVDESCKKQKEELSLKKYWLDFFDAESLKFQDIFAMKSKYPFLEYCKIVVFDKQVNFYKTIVEEYQKKQLNNFKLEVHEERRKHSQTKHQRIFSENLFVTHNKNTSNFSNLSAISKVENQSVVSNQPSDIFENNQSSILNATLNQNSSFLMMGALSDYDKEQKQERKVDSKQQKQSEKAVLGALNRIYSIREENSNNETNNMSTSTQNSVRKRNRKWPIPYFQSMKTPKYERGSKYDAEVYLRELAQKGILMIRREKAEEYLLNSEVSRAFVRNIGQRQIEYVAYIIDFLSVECLTWVIESVKEDKMTPNQKLIQSRLKQSFDLKINMKLWESIIKYLQSEQYEQEYAQNNKVRYVPKISVVRYEDEYLLEFEERKWAYEDQQLLDEQEEEWRQFKQLITDYFNDKSQITGGRYGCVQYVKLNGPKPLRKCSLGKISMFVQEAINKGIIRYHKTLLVSNCENSSSFCSQKLSSLDQSHKLLQLQKDLKVMAIQLSLIDMFLEVAPNTQISLAQIPLNLKKSIIFEYTLVQLGFPKLKNILNTLADKLILQTNKTHVSYDITTNGAETIQKMRRQAMQQNQFFLSHIVSQIATIAHHFQSLTLEDLYSQLNTRIGFPFDYKLYQLADFYQFVLYYCANVVTVQFIAGMFVVSSNYQQSYPVYQRGQQIYPNYSNYYYSPNLEDFKNPNLQEFKNPNLQDFRNTNLEPYQPSYSEEWNAKRNAPRRLEVGEPQLKGVTSIQGKGVEFGWNEYLDQQKRDQKHQEEEDQDENHSRQMEHIINILDDGDVSVTHSKTVIVKEGLQQQQFYILPKFRRAGDQMDSAAAQDAQWAEIDCVNKAGKGQHTRFKSSNQVASKHFRQYSTANAQK